MFWGLKIFSSPNYVVDELITITINVKSLDNMIEKKLPSLGLTNIFSCHKFSAKLCVDGWIRRWDLFILKDIMDLFVSVKAPNKKVHNITHNDKLMKINMF